MIPRAHVTHWRGRAPWPLDAQVEQDLVLSRALVELYRDPELAVRLAFRGGTALHKLFLGAPGRYSEDIDLVQRGPGPIGPILDAVRARLDPWLGDASWKQGEGRAALVYRFESTALPVQSMRLKVEINTREHFTVLGARLVPFAVESPWFHGLAQVATFEIEELLGTKLRALYQRKKGRDLYDLAAALASLEVDDARVLSCFEQYLAHSGGTVTRAAFEANLGHKLADRGFLGDVAPLLAEPAGYDPTRGAQLVLERLISRLPGEPGRRSDGRHL